MYGQTETACLATMGTYDECSGSAGRCIPLGLLELVDDSDNPVASGEVGEITLKGPMVFKAYWNLERDNALTFRNGRHNKSQKNKHLPMTKFQNHKQKKHHFTSVWNF